MSFYRDICRMLRIDNPFYIEIESKKRILARQAKDLKKFIADMKRTSFKKTVYFFDQFLDTPRMDLFKAGASMRLRYKSNGTKVYLQYKGPGFLQDGLLWRSEFSSENLNHLILEESHHDMIHFKSTTIQRILKRSAPAAMRQAMREHLGKKAISQITRGPILCLYRKDKFEVDLGSAFLEPSIDRIFAFHINPAGLHPLSTFYEFENEIKAPRNSLKAKLEHMPELLKYNDKILENFDLKPEKLDKYHRCTSIFLPKSQRK